MSDDIELEDAARKLLDALGVEEAWNMFCADTKAGREPMCPFPEDFDEDTVYECVRQARSELQSLVMDRRFARTHPDICAWMDSLGPRDKPL